MRRRNEREIMRFIGDDERRKMIKLDTKKYVVEIPLKLPSLNQYICACRYNRYAGAKMKKDVQNAISIYLNKLPRLNHVRIDFEWYEGNKKRDLDNVCFSKKFILDALVDLGKLKNDNRNNVCSFSDTFYYDKDWKVVLNITEVPND